MATEPKTSALHAGGVRELWPNRLSFILRSMLWFQGLGNMFRYPSQAWRNYGLQWFVPYLLALFFIGIPLLALEMILGQISRSGAVTAFGRVSPRLRGMGLAAQVTGYIVATYYVPIISYGVYYFFKSFTSPLPWTNCDCNFRHHRTIVGYKDLSVPEPDVGAINWPLFGCIVFVWVTLYLSTFRGPSLLGKIVYITMGFPIAMLVVIIVRGVTLDNAWDGIKLYIGTWRSDNIATTKPWTAAVGQIFFSIGICCGIYSAYGSYNPVTQNAVQDAVIVALANSAFEVFAAFAAFGVAGFLKLDPAQTQLGTFVLGFLTYPEALARIPGANVWAVLFFINVYMLGIDSAISLTETLATSLYDSRLLKGMRKDIILLVLCVIGCLWGLLYSAGFGLDALDYVDKYTNEMGMVLFGYAYAFGAGYLYRYQDVISQVGFPAFATHMAFYILSPVIGIIVAYEVTAVAGGITGVALAVVGLVLTFFLAQTPSITLGFSPLVAKLYYLNLYTADQLRKDINAVVGNVPGNWKLPLFWSVTLKFVTGPILLSELSLGQDDDDHDLTLFGNSYSHCLLLSRRPW
ncbi:Sodium:neurotransmitter symporter [Gonapodya prolifera JEL478]|uniref:Sodium:neurotransmitter symporter n=1 Tax=Gonapodya prolifera (strain JEL478) TaxID=1344416 RepID=A0A139A9J6_GONPJ|nr:Sodium:neurotransmitter symporter [Gonapodya prolifera JEL478]|eukprot:KXS13338.1 Sodium:neurotransmitter symporter [Gonapodya prolifera JEL478]